MSSNSRFVVAVHAVVLLATHPGERVTSELLASSASTNPVVIRRLMTSLRDSGLVAAEPGRCGGFTLARPADRITLLDIYRAVGEDGVFATHPTPPNPACPVGANILDALRAPLRTAAMALEEALAARTIAEIAASVAVHRRN